MRYSISFACALALSASALHAQFNNPPWRVARVSALVGQVSLQPSSTNEWGEVTLNYPVTTGDRLYTARASRIELEIGATSLRLSEEADVTITNLDDNLLQLGIAQGVLRVRIYRLPRGESVELDTPNGALMITAPGDYRVEVPADADLSFVSVYAGTLEVLGPGVDQELRSGQAVQLSGSDRIRAISIPLARQTSFDTWGGDRDRRYAAATCSRYMSYDIPGCVDLDDAGRWEANQEYGAVWYPSHVNADWVPYRDGRWVWVEPWGWSWVADEPWGYAPFHYGRWARFGPAWGWIPGPIVVRPYYAPALVAFIGGPGWSIGVTVGTQAWFPLGPREAYIPSYHHDDAYVRQVNITNIRNITNINTIINVTNVDQINYVNRSTGITAVSTEAFRTGQRVASSQVRIKPDEGKRGEVITHPVAAPDVRAVLGGRPAPAPPVAAKPAMSRKALPQRDRVVNPTPPPVTAEPPVPPKTNRGDTPPNTPPNQSRGKTIITAAPPPPTNPPFKAKEDALKKQPGKPLDPQQVENIRSGRAAGPPKDTAAKKQEPPGKKAPPARGGKQDTTGKGRGRGRQ